MGIGYAGKMGRIQDRCKSCDERYGWDRIDEDG